MMRHLFSMKKLFNSIHESVIKGFLRFTHCKHCKRISLHVYVCVHLNLMKTPFLYLTIFVNMQKSTMCLEP